MGTYTKESLEQLKLGNGEILFGDTPLVLLKSFLQSGISYLGGYPGSPTAGLIDVISAAYEPILREKGIYFDCSGNEASAAALLSASISYPIRGSVNWKIVGTNVASDALSHICSSGVTGGAMVVVGEDYGCDSTCVAEKAMPFALKSSMGVIDPRGDHQVVSRMVQKGFELSEYSNMPVMFLLSTRIAHIRNKMICSDNVNPAISTLNPLDDLITDIEKIPIPPYTRQQEKIKYHQRIPAAIEFIKNSDINEYFDGDNKRIGIITHGTVYNSVMRSLTYFGEADIRGRTNTYPLVYDQLVNFMQDKEAVLIVEEGMPNLIEEQIRSIAQRARLDTYIYGKDLLSYEGEFTPDRISGGLSDFLIKHCVSDTKSKYINDRRDSMESQVVRKDLYSRQ